MRPTFVKLLLAITLSGMVVLAATGAYMVAVQSQVESIVIPPASLKSLPSQAPRPTKVIPNPQQAPFSADSPGTIRR